MSKQQTTTSKQAVYCLSTSGRCFGCDQKLATGDLAKITEGQNGKELHCLKCSQLDCLTVLRSGNAKVTRLATKQSSTVYAILQWSELWKCYERVGVLVEPQAIKQVDNKS